MNVKPGDIARVIADPETYDGHTNVGKQCIVVRGLDAMDFLFEPFLIVHTRDFGTLWECRPLEGFWGWDTASGLGAPRVFVLPERGLSLIIPDRFLKRIDPPADSLDVFKPEALPHEQPKEPQSA